MSASNLSSVDIPPSTPCKSRIIKCTSHSRYPLHQTYRPLNSSPLASPSSHMPSPYHESEETIPSSSTNRSTVSERRKLQYKSQTPTRRPSGSFSSPHQPRHAPSRARSITSSGGTVFASPKSTSGWSASRQVSENPQKDFFLERIQAKARERIKARAAAVKKRRYSGHSDRSSDVDDDMDDEEEENDDDVMGDELFRRIMLQAERKMQHKYRVSYAREVGSSFDPDLEDAAEWERELRVQTADYRVAPIDPDDEDELDVYADEFDRQAALDDFADIPEEELFHLSDIDEVDEERHKLDDMDTS